jgi:hypothetical protein
MRKHPHLCTAGKAEIGRSFLGKVLPPYRSEILQCVRWKCNRVWANFFTIFLQSLFGKRHTGGPRFDSCTIRRPS